MVVVVVVMMVMVVVVMVMVMVTTLIYLERGRRHRKSTRRRLFFVAPPAWVTNQEFPIACQVRISALRTTLYSILCFGAGGRYESTLLILEIANPDSYFCASANASLRDAPAPLNLALIDSACCFHNTNNPHECLRI